jgi:hypothetical protein
MRSQLGRPRKYGRAARAVTVTLPEDVLGRLSTINADIGTAIVHVIERKRRSRVDPVAAAEISRYGKHAVIVVTPVRALRRLKGVQLVPIGEGRALISLDSTHSVAELELQLRDAMEDSKTKRQEREALELIAEILRGARGGHRLETRSIIVLAAKQDPGVRLPTFVAGD